jgi:hypothetical protein
MYLAFLSETLGKPHLALLATSSAKQSDNANRENTVSDAMFATGLEIRCALQKETRLNCCREHFALGLN